MISGDLTERETEGLQHMCPSGAARTITHPPPPHISSPPHSFLDILPRHRGPGPRQGLREGESAREQ